MNTNPKQTTGKTHSAAVCPGIVMLFSLFLFTWLPTPAVDAALLLISPPDCKTPDTLLCDATDAVTVFRWTRSEDPRVHSYRVIFSENPGFEDPLFQGGIIPELPGPNDEKIIAPQAALDLVNGPFLSSTPYYWRVVALDESGSVVEEGQETFAFYFEQDGSEFTVISGLVKSDLNQAALVGAQVAVSSNRHTATTDTTNSIATTVFNGQYIVIALTRDSNNDPIPFPIEITYTREGFQSTVVGDLQETEKVNGVITRDVVMTGDFDGDGISDTAENASSCLNNNDADTDDDGIADGDEDTNKNGVKDPAETDPCRLDTDNDGIQDGTELGLTLIDIGSDTDTAIFQPDLDPSTKTNPLDDDSDNDGLLDGEEDRNHNGRLDDGETDPSFLNDLPLSSSLKLDTPTDCETTDPNPPCGPTDRVTVFRWTRSDNPRVHSYRVIFREDPDFVGRIIRKLPEPGDEKIIAPQVALNLNEFRPSENFFFDGTNYYWRVVALDEFGNDVEQSSETFAFFYRDDPSGFTVITGLVKSDLNQAALVAARVAVSSAPHTDLKNNTNYVAATEFNGKYIVIALTTDEFGNPIDFPLQITATKEGFRPIVVDQNELPPKDADGVITVEDLVMESTVDSDGDGIRDAVENASCLNTNDADTDDDGIADGDEDTNKNGVKDSVETDPCRRDTDNDGIQDGTELGLTFNDIGSDTDAAIFQPDLDPRSTSNPLDDDSDNDGQLDGEEDRNHNGRLDDGETDPILLNTSALPAILLLLIGD